MASTPQLLERPRLVTGWCWLVALLLLSHPLRSVDLWWDLSRGREVVGGAVRPCQNLLVLDHASEAAWLGGVPFFCLWSVGGVFALATVPLIAGLALFSRVRSTRATRPALSIVVAVLLLFAVRADLEPTAWLFDLIGLVAVAAVLKRSGTTRSLPVILAIIFASWANLGPRPLWGLLLVALWPAPVTNRGKVVLVSILAGMLTPRGPLTWLDSLVLFAPSAFVPSAELMEPRWRSLWGADWDASLVAGLVLWSVTAVHVCRSDGLRSARGVMLLIPLIAVALAQQNLGPASLWTAMLWRMVAREESEDSVQGRSRWLAPALVGMTLLAIADARGMIDPDADTLGWGLSQAIDPRLLQIDDSIPGNESVNAWCADSRSAGVAAWACRKAKPVDHPLRAILGRRTRLHADLRSDLVTAHQWRYQRDDGLWGGWAHRLREWRATLMFVSAEDSQLHRALIETPWKLIKLDSPTAPYVSAENPRYDQAVVSVMRQQGLVETGWWQPSIDIYNPQGWRVDAAGMLGLMPSASPAIRQAGFFRAIQLPMAAARSLAPIRHGGGTRSVRAEFIRCQEALARDEWNASGRVSRFRRAVLLSASPSTTRDPAPWLEDAAEKSPPDKEWRKCVELYGDGRTVEAATALTGVSVHDHYARGLLWVEAGEIEQAGRAFRAAAAGEGAEKIAAEYWLEQIAPAKRD